MPEHLPVAGRSFLMLRHLLWGPHLPNMGEPRGLRHHRPPSYYAASCAHARTPKILRFPCLSQHHGKRWQTAAAAISRAGTPRAKEH